jgi:hypothetical protein
MPGSLEQIQLGEGENWPQFKEAAMLYSKQVVDHPNEVLGLPLDAYTSPAPPWSQAVMRMEAARTRTKTPIQLSGSFCPSWAAGFSTGKMDQDSGVDRHWRTTQ